jgi:hypothetical protein
MGLVGLDEGMVGGRTDNVRSHCPPGLLRVRSAEVRPSSYARRCYHFPRRCMNLTESNSPMYDRIAMPADGSHLHQSQQ